MNTVFVTDDKLSLTAKGVYVTMYYLGTGGNGVSVEDLFKSSKDSKYVIRNAIKELISLGYIKKDYIKIGKSRGGSKVVYRCVFGD